MDEKVLEEVYMIANVHESFRRSLYPELTKKQKAQHVVNVRNSNKEPKVNRNDLCPCGSGKKYKKCCLIKN